MSQQGREMYEFFLLGDEQSVAALASERVVAFHIY